MVILLRVSAGLRVFYSINPYLHLYGILGAGNLRVWVNLPAGFFTGFLRVPSVHPNPCYPLLSIHLKKGEYTKHAQQGPGMSFFLKTSNSLVTLIINIGLLRFDDFKLLKMLPPDSESESEEEEEPLSSGIKHCSKSTSGPHKLFAFMLCDCVTLMV